MQFAVMEPADRDRVFVTDLAAQRARLSEPKVMGFSRRSAADHAGLHSDVRAVLLVAQANRLGSDAAAACIRLGEPWVNGRVLHWRKEELVSSQGHFASRSFPTIARLTGWLYPSGGLN